MPESKCNECGASTWKPTSTALEQWELKHHSDSATTNQAGERLHRCRGFLELNENDKPKTLRIYNYDMLVKTIDAS